MGAVEWNNIKANLSQETCLLRPTPTKNHSSSHSKPQLLEVRDASDLRRKIGGDSKATDRRKRNGESAKRSRDKRKMRITEMEENYEQLEEGHKRLLEENLKLRELVASLGGDVSTLPSVPPLDSISEDLAIPLKKAKHTKIECRVDTTANSFESAAGALQPAGRGDHCTTFGLLSNNEYAQSDEHRILTSVHEDALDAIGNLDWLSECAPTDEPKALSMSSTFTSPKSDDSQDITSPDEMELESGLLDLVEFIFD